MKRNFLFALVGIIAMLTSCNKEEVGSLATNKTTSFNVSVDGGVKTRAEVTDLTRYVMEVYKGTTATGTPEMHIEQATGTFTDMLLDNGQEYTVLFWADYGTPSTDGTHNATNEYNATDLKAARVAAGKQPTKAAYAGVSKFTVGTTDESVYTNVTLTHAVAQVNFMQTESLTSATNTLTVSYPESYSLNVGDNAVTKIDGAITHTFAYNQKAAGTLGTSYIIAATSTPKTVMEVTATLNSETAIPVTNVPFERNYKTNISGAYSSKYAAVLTVTCDDTWGTPDNEEGFPTEKKSIIGYYYYSDGSCESTYTNTGKTCIGVVFWENEDGTQGKIAALTDSEKLMWADNSLTTKEWGFSNKSDGTAATKALISDQVVNNEEDFEYFYPIFHWLYAKKNGSDINGRWYIPAIDELEQLLTAAIENETFKSSLANAGTALRIAGDKPAWYWSATEGRPGSTGKLAINVAQIQGTNSNTVNIQFTPKEGSTCVRAISAITINNK